MSEPTPPHALSLVDKNDEGIFKSNIDEVEQILLDPAIRDLPVAIVSVAGKYRRGKSFLLNFFLRYLNKKVRHFVFLIEDIFCFQNKFHNVYISINIFS